MSIQEVIKTVHIDKGDNEFWRYEIAWITPEVKALVRVSKSLPDMSATQYSAAIDSFEVDIPIERTPQGKAFLKPNNIAIDNHLIKECEKHRKSFKN